MDNINNYSEHVMPAYNRFPIVIDHGEGSRLYDKDGKEYIDFVAGIAVNALGYNDHELAKVIADQFGKVQHISNLYWSEPLADAGKTLSEATGLDEIFYTNSGAEAIECAIKLARRHQNLHKSPEAVDIITMEGSFHGRTYGAVSATGQPKYHETFGPMLPNIKYAKFNDIDSLKELIGDTTAAVIIEPIKGEGGIIPADEEYLKEVKELCDKTNTLLIFDEIQCGAGRSGEFLASSDYGIKPDILTLAKGIGAGFPVGACIATKEVGDSLTPGTHGSTYGGNPLACHIVDYVVNRINSKEFLDQVKENGEYFKNELLKLQEKYPDLIKDVRGKGLILGIELNVNAGDVVNENLKNGLLTVTAANNTIRFVPPLIITKEEIKKGLDILEESLVTVANQ